jgi:hypothetical protein
MMNGSTRRKWHRGHKWNTTRTAITGITGSDAVAAPGETAHVAPEPPRDENPLDGAMFNVRLPPRSTCNTAELRTSRGHGVKAL